MINVLDWLKNLFNEKPNEIDNMRPREGSIVRLKTGNGPIMVVGCRVGDANWCSWFDEELKIFKEALLYLSQLEEVKND